MIKTTLGIIGLIISLAGCSLVPELDNLGPDLGVRVQNVSQVCVYIRNHINPNDQIDHYLPAKTLERGNGSCIDRCLVALKILHDSGIDDGQLIYTAPLFGQGHSWIKVNGTEYDPFYVDGKILNDPSDYQGCRAVVQYKAIVNSAWVLRINLE